MISVQLGFAVSKVCVHPSDVVIKLMLNMFLRMHTHCMYFALERFQCFADGETTVVNTSYENYLQLFGGGSFSLTGKVVICHDGVYSPVCDINWDRDDATVFCNSFGIGGNYSKQLYLPTVG